MKPEDLPSEVRPFVLPRPRGGLVYRCLGCGAKPAIDELLYTCPQCGGLLLIEDQEFDRLKETPGHVWRQVFDYRRMLNLPALKGVFLFHELVAPLIPLEDVVYLGEGQTPVVAANETLAAQVGRPFFFKNDGQNPSASFKDRGMASALSFLNHLLKTGRLDRVLAVCASTGDTSAAAALYASYLSGRVSSAVLLPQGKVTPHQLSQPLGAGAAVLELPGVFDDCMKVVEKLADDYPVVLLNSKNAWRILGQETYSFEVAQAFDWEVEDLAVFVPVGNAGNITAVMAGFIKLLDLGIINGLPRIVGVQSEHADPVYRYYLESVPAKRRFEPVQVQASVAQAAMIGNPVSMPRVISLAQEVRRLSGQEPVVVQVSEQEIIEAMLTANQQGHVVCTQGGECLAGLKVALDQGLLSPNEKAVLDSTAHMLKLVDFQTMYFEDSFPPEFEISPRQELQNRPRLIKPQDTPCPAPDRPLGGKELEEFVAAAARMIAEKLGLEPK
ncbi:MAG: threonine synthase [Deltaproteobacteria bacterium]|nr:threonine synthase [Deltaproteobacteria bacterium]